MPLPGEPRFRAPRMWSNAELRRIAPLVTGDVANVSAADDLDKEGSRYQAYFTGARSYTLTNFPGAEHRGYRSRPGEIPLDLTAPLPPDLRRRYDAVFNHTTLEHVFEVRVAFHHLCELTRDLAIVVVPFCQVQHESPGYRDFWRFTPSCLRALFEAEGMAVVHEAANEAFNESVYLFFVASRHPQRWTPHLPALRPPDPAGAWIGGPPAPGPLLRQLAGWAARRMDQARQRFGARPDSQ